MKEPVTARPRRAQPWLALTRRRTASCVTILFTSLAFSQEADSQEQDSRKRADPGAALDAALAELDATTPPPSPSPAAVPTAPAAYEGLYARDVGTSQLRLIDISLDILAAAGASSERDESLLQLQAGGHDPRKRGFTFSQAELSFLGAVDPYFTAEAHILFFLDPVEGETEVELEEAFATSQALPWGLELEVGHFLTEVGRINPRHPHQWEFLDQPIINSRLFGADGMRAPGARLGWLTPLPWFSEVHAGVQNANGETMASFLANDEFFEERSIGGWPFSDREVRSTADLVYLARWANGFDLATDWSLAFGGTGLFGPNATGPDGRTSIAGADLVLKWRPVSNDRGWPYMTWQAEFLQRFYEADDALNEGDPDDPSDDVLFPSETLDDWGFYAQWIWGFVRNWSTGLRFEYADGAGSAFGGRQEDPFRDERFRISPLVTWRPTEFTRFRLQYNYDNARHLDSNDAHTAWIGAEFFFGSHPAHAY